MATASGIVLYTNKHDDQSSAGRLGRRSTMRDLIVKINSTLDQSTVDADDQSTERSSFRETEFEDDDIDYDRHRAPTSSSVHGFDGDDGSDSGTAGSLSGPSLEWTDLEVLDPDHPILERFQANLTRLLLDEDEQLNLRIIEMEERRKAVLRDRKRLCIGLDEAKRTSEKVQASLRKEKEALEAERARRADVERKLLPDKRHQLETARREVEEARDVEARLEKEMADGRNKLADIRQSLVDQQWQLAQARGRLDQGGRQRENTQMQKLLQDMMVAQLMSDLDSAEWKRGQIESLMLEEEQMAAGMREAIRNAHAEIDALNAEKIRLNQHWQSNVLALQRAHEALSNTHQAIREEEARREEIIRCFLIGERETAELAAKRTSVQLELGRLERKITNLETQRQDRETAKKTGDERKRLMQSTIASREQELGALIKERDQLIKSEEDALERLHSQRSKCKALEAALLDQVYRSVACDQQGQAIYRDIRRAEEASSQLDLKMAEAESRAARLLIERDDLDKELEAGAKKLDDKTAKYSRTETELKARRQRLIELHKVVERKDAHLVRTKARLVELGLVRAKSDGTRNEEERAIRVLHEQIDKLRSDCDEMQRQWARAEQHLLSVAMARDSQTIDEDKLREETQVWQEKKRRLLAELDGLRTSRAQCQRSVHSWREYLQQLDSRLAEQTSNKENLERCNQLFQRQWTMHLEEPERKVERLRLEIQSQREQKCNLEISLCNLSKLAMLWTAKLNDIREAQNYIQAERSDLGELAMLQAERHRLEVQETQLKKDQEMLNHQLQKALFGRPLLNAKANVKAGVDHKTRIIRQPVDSSPWHKILSKEITQRRKDLNKLVKLLEQKRATLDDLNAEREELQSGVDENRQRREHIEADITQAKLSKKKAIGDLTVQQQWWRFYEQLKRGTYRRRSGSESLADSEARARQNLVNLAAVADRLAREHPHLATQLGEIRESLLQSTNQ